ncbi:RTA1 like protein-domain-containing protein [Plectosphaerella cucumerina]|uniref:RTA1 like protein-domain-containing protein n=1 Tax=Plectosphaerella cucumerina TaxID=40658 RepID=A0A8K0TTP1_9PEZI|nr:RTA1 like protein-domain-containing protein [Plectosphaerella cucumerina]
MAVLEPLKSGYYIWKYLPSVPAAAIFCVLFLVATMAHAWRIWKTRNWFCIAFAVGGFFQFIGYAARCSAHNKTGRLMPYIIQSTFILLAPILYAASIYMTLGRVIRSVNGDRHSIIRPAILTKIFVTCDITALMVQGSSAGLSIMESFANIGKIVLVIGLVFHILLFGFFWVVAWVFHRRMLKDPSASAVANRDWEKTLRMLYSVSALIIFRSVFRAIEHVMGVDGYLLSREWPLYVFDSIPMLAVMVIFWYWFPPSLQKVQEWRLSSSNTYGSSIIHLDVRNGK